MTNSSAQQPVRRKKNIILIIGILLIAFIAINWHKTVNTVECTPEIIQHRPDVIMLGAWWCTYCYQAKKYFQENHISYCEYDMENTKRGKQLYKEMGEGAIPLLLIGKYRLQGFNPEQIKAAIKETHNQKTNPLL